MTTSAPRDSTGQSAAVSGSRYRFASWVLTLVAVIAIVWFVTDLLRQCAPTRVADSLGQAAVGSIDALGRASVDTIREGRAVLKDIADVLKPSVMNTPLVVLRGDDATPKIVVFTHLADVSVDLVSDTMFGDTYSRIEAKNCRAQFVVPVDRMTDRDVMFIPGNEGQPARIVVLAPRPRVDVEMLAIVPESIEFTERNTGLLHARSWVGMDNRDQLVRQLRPKLLEAVSNPVVRAKAEQAGRDFFEKRFAEWIRGDLQIGRDVVVDVRWTE